MADDEVGWEPVLPFVVCESQGGQYEDDAFTAGFACGALYVGIGNLKVDKHRMDQPIQRSYLPQVDLIAMHFGYTMEVEEGDDPDWCHVVFHKQRPEFL